MYQLLTLFKEPCINSIIIPNFSLVSPTINALLQAYAGYSKLRLKYILNIVNFFIFHTKVNLALTCIYSTELPLNI